MPHYSLGYQFYFITQLQDFTFFLLTLSVFSNIKKSQNSTYLNSFMKSITIMIFLNITYLVWSLEFNLVSLLIDKNLYIIQYIQTDKVVCLVYHVTISNATYLKCK